MENYPKMHISLYVSDIEKTVQFYQSFFGQEPNKVKPKYAKFELTKPALVISFVEDANRVSSRFGHLGFQVESTEALARQRSRIENTSLRIALEEEAVSCCYAKQDKFWVNDPDGHQWEVYYFHSDSEFNDPKAEACCPATSNVHKAEEEPVCCNKEEETVPCC